MHCANDFSTQLRLSWHNYSATAFNGNSIDYEKYVCRYASFDWLKSISQPIERQLIILFSICGFLGGLLTICTLSQKRFRVLDFQLYRLIGYLEMVQMAVIATMELLAYVGCPRSYACTFLWAHVGFVIMNICADAIDLLVLFLCVERIVACLLPFAFPRLHNRTWYNWVILFSLVIPSIFSCVQAFELRVVYDDTQQRYRDEPSDFGSSDFYALIILINTARFYAMAALILITTALSIFGFYAVAKRRRNLSKNHSNRSMTKSISSLEAIAAAVCTNASDQQKSMRKIDNRKRVRKRETELCCLQLCLAVPIVINHVLYATGLNMNSAHVVGEAALKKNLDFQTASDQLERMIAFYSLRMATNLTNVLAHALHFYLYLLFSLQVRQGFLILMRTCRVKLSLRKNGDSGNMMMVSAKEPSIS